MTLIDRLEKLGRLILWLSLSAFCVGVPLAASAQAREGARAAERLQESAEKARADAEKEKKAAASPARLTLASMGTWMSARNGASGTVWFTNVSDRAGFVCVDGLLTNQKTKQTMRSLPACEETHPYASVMIKVMFAGATLDDVCPAGVCDLSIKDVP